MAARNSVGIQICLSSPTAPTGNDITPTAVAATSGTPAGVSVTGTGLTVAVGDVVKFPADFGYTSLNGKSFVITKVTGATGFEIGNVTLGTGTMKTGAKISSWKDADMQCLCLNALSIASVKPQVIDTSTFCGSSSIASAKSESGSATASGYIDKDDLGYQTVLAASEDATERTLRIKLGATNGYIVVPVTVTALSWAIGLDTAQTFSFEFIFGAKPVHVF
jgi:hypothetical protein